MARIGYARVSTEDQNLDGQFDALKAAGAEKIFADKITGTARSRPELDRLLDQLRQGDVITVTKYDRLARSLPEARDIAKIGLANYFAGAALLPYRAFQQAALDERHDL